MRFRSGEHREKMTEDGNASGRGSRCHGEKKKRKYLGWNWGGKGTRG